jgi:hypothetical protein
VSNFRHGMCHTKIYGVWTAMVARCTNPNVLAFRNYGGRGVTVCERWMDFALFFEDMGLPQPGQTLDRINNNLGYCKENCRWADLKQQARNKRSTRMLTIDDETKSMAEWCEVSGTKLATIWKRIADGWPARDAVFLPPVQRKGIKRGEKLYQGSVSVPGWKA